jgi:hypothetical protein
MPGHKQSENHYMNIFNEWAYRKKQRELIQERYLLGRLTKLLQLFLIDRRDHDHTEPQQQADGQ